MDGRDSYDASTPWMSSIVDPTSLSDRVLWAAWKSRRSPLSLLEHENRREDEGHH
jgi:hypothetical protein